MDNNIEEFAIPPTPWLAPSPSPSASPMTSISTKSCSGRPGRSFKKPTHGRVIGTQLAEHR